MENIQDKWWYNAIVYQIYPRSFKDSNGDGIGDLRGIIEKLDYLGKTLKVDAIWLSPIYKSPQKDFGYDIADYRTIDPLFGNLEIFDELIKESHKRNIQVIMDFVPNHTSSQHPWYLESKSSRDNPKRDWYIWRDGKPDGGPPNNWLSVFGGSAWTLDKNTNQYYLHSFVKQQPDLNWRNDEVKNEMTKVLQYWIDKGVDGFRTDAIYHILEDEKFRDDPINPNYRPDQDPPYDSLLHTNSSRGQELKELLKATMCKVLSLNEDTFMISEVDLDVPDMTTLYDSCPNKNHIPFNFNLLKASWSSVEYKKIVDDFEDAITPENMPNYVLGNHDRSRVATRLGLEKARLTALIQLTLRGMAVIYYGEEIGMTDAQIPTEKLLDPWEKNVPGFNLGRDPERTPMQWNSTNFAGFSEINPWLPVNSDFKEVNVAKEKTQETSTLNLYRTLISLRNKSKALKLGSYKKLPLLGNDQVFAYIRKYENEKVFIAVNFSDSSKKVDISNLSLNFNLELVECRANCVNNHDSKDKNILELCPLEGIVASIS